MNNNNINIKIFTMTSILILLNKWYKNRNKPIIRYKQQQINNQNNSNNKKEINLSNLIINTKSLFNYIPPPLIDYWGHLHTILNHFIRSYHSILHDYKRELLILNDGGTIALDWLPNQPLNESKRPIVMLIHGLCGNRESNHIVYAAYEFQKSNYDVVAFIARGCGGLKLTSPESFTAARTSDLRFAIEHVKKSYPERDVFAVGYSLGAGILLKYLGQSGNDSLLSAAVAVSPSWNFLLSTPVFEWWSKFRLVEGLREYLKEHLEYISSHPSNLIKIDETLKSKNVREFDHNAVVPVHGYRDVDHYYFDASAIHHSKGISTPTLALSAEDDPVCSIEGCPWNDLDQFGDGLVVARTRTGGHVAFSTYELLFGKTTSWMDQVAIDWFEAYQMNSKHLTNDSNK